MVINLISDRDRGNHTDPTVSDSHMAPWRAWEVSFLAQSSTRLRGNFNITATFAESGLSGRKSADLEPKIVSRRSGGPKKTCRSSEPGCVGFETCQKNGELVNVSQSSTGRGADTTTLFSVERSIVMAAICSAGTMHHRAVEGRCITVLS